MIQPDSLELQACFNKRHNNPSLFIKQGLLNLNTASKSVPSLMTVPSSLCCCTAWKNPPKITKLNPKSKITNNLSPKESPRLCSNPNCLVTQISWQAEGYRDVLNKLQQLLLAATSREAQAAYEKAQWFCCNCFILLKKRKKKDAWSNTQGVTNTAKMKQSLLGKAWFMLFLIKADWMLEHFGCLGVQLS